MDLPKTLRVWVEDAGTPDEILLADLDPKFNVPTEVGVYVLMDRVIVSPEKHNLSEKEAIHG